MSPLYGARGDAFGARRSARRSPFERESGTSGLTSRGFCGQLAQCSFGARARAYSLQAPERARAGRPWACVMLMAKKPRTVFSTCGPEGATDVLSGAVVVLCQHRTLLAV